MLDDLFDFVSNNSSSFFALNAIEKYISIKLIYFKVLIKETLPKIFFNTDMKFRNIRETYVSKISLNICFFGSVL